MRRSWRTSVLILCAVLCTALSAQTVSFRLEQLSAQEGQADSKCLQVGVYMTTNGYDGNEWNSIVMAIEYTDPDLILNSAPRGRLSRFAGSSNGAADPYGLSDPATPLPSSACSAGNTVNAVTLGNSSAIDMMRNSGNPSAGGTSAFIDETTSEVNQRISLSMFSFDPDPIFVTQDGVEYLVAILEFQLKSNLTENDSLTFSFRAGEGNNTISFTADGGTTADSNGNNTSGSFLVEACGAVSVQSQPAGAAVCDGATANFSVSVAGSAPFTFQWRKDGVNVAGATSSTLTLNNVTPADTGSYDCVITNSCGNVTSASAALTVDPFVVSAEQTAFTQGVDPITLSVDQECGVDPVGYEWRELPSGNVVGTNATFTIDPPLRSSASFEVEVTSGSGSSGTVEFFVLANGDSIDPNNDGFVTIEDLYFAIDQLWLTDDATFDVDGSGLVRVNDLIYIYPAN